jgi:hypothetical protein
VLWIRNQSDPKLLAQSGSGSGGNHFGFGSGQIRDEFEIKLLRKAGKIFFACFIFFILRSSKFWARIGVQPKMLDPDPESINPDPKHWSLQIRFPLNTIPPLLTSIS